MKTSTVEPAKPSTVQTQAEATPFFAAQRKEGEGSSAFFVPTVQAKMKVSDPDDPQEREADRMADRIVNRQPSGPQEVSAKLLQRQGGEEEEETVQAKCDACATKAGEPESVPAKLLQRQEGEEEVQAKLLQRQEGEEEEEVPAKLLQRQEGEEEEEVPAKLLQRQEGEEEEEVPAKLLQRQEGEEEEEVPAKLLQRQEGEEEEEVPAKLLQRQRGEEEEEVQTKLLQRQEGEEEEELQAKATRAPIVTQDVATQIDRAKGKGRPLSDGVRAEMEAGLGGDFSEVRIHTDAEGEGLSQALNAQAFAVGKDVFFNKNKFNPSSRDGKHLLAHELTHTLQQGAVRRQPVLFREGGDEAELAEQLRESARDRQEAIDPQPAEQARQQAEQEALAAEQTALAAVPDPEPPAVIAPPETPPAAAVATPANNPAPRVSSEIQPESGPLGPAGEQLATDSAGACQQAANDAQQLANNQQAHDDPNTLVDQAEGAVEPPAEETQSRANAEQVETVEGADTPQPDAAAAQRELDEAISDAVPGSVEDMNDFASEGKGQVIGNKVLEETARQTGEVEGTYAAIEEAPAAAPAEPATPLPPQPAAPPTPTLDLGEGAVPELAEEQTDVTEFTEGADELWEKEGVTPDLQAEIEQVDSGPLGEANTTRSEFDEKVATQPQAVRETAQTEQQRVETEMQQEEAQARQEMDATRQQELQGAAEEQTRTKTAMELKREEVTKWINDRYESAKTVVEEKLAKLETEAMATFDRGQQQLSVAFERNVNRRVDAWKDERYSGLFGGVKWLKDKLVGIDHFPEVKEIFSSEREAFVLGIDQLIADINRESDLVIQSCKDEVALAQTEIQEYVDQLSPDLQEVGQKALEETTAKLAELDKQVDEKKEALQQALCDKRDAAIQAIDEKIEEMKSEMGGLVSKLGNLLLEAAKKFFMWALEKAGLSGGKLMEIINKGATVLKAIFTDPIGFFVNLGKAVGGGINQFVTNIVKWLKEGLVSWLTGAMGDSGLELPEKFDLKGILFLGLQVAGLTWNVIRARLVKVLGSSGEKMVSAAEKGVDIIKRVITEGPMALWNIIAEKAGEIKETVLEGIRNWAITQIVKKATFKLLSMLNPAGAIVQAIILLYDTVMFFVENWQRIVDFVGSIFDSIGNIARGAVGAAAGFIERALGQTVPIIISFLARFIGLGGIGKAIKNIIKQIQKPFKKILDNIIQFLVKQVRKIFGKGGKKGKKEEDDPENKTGATEIKLPFKMKGKQHDLTLIGGAAGKVKMASANKEPISKKVDNAINKLKPEQTDPEVAERIKRLGAIKSKAVTVEADLKKHKDGLLDNKAQAAMRNKGAGLVDLITKYAKDFDQKDIAGILDDYPGPKVDSYGKLSGSEGPLFDGTVREAHHAPPDQLAKSLSSALKEAYTAMSVDYDDSGDYSSVMDILSDDFAEADDPLTQGAAFLTYTYSSVDWFEPLDAAAQKLDNTGSDGLPAILVHAQTHRVKGAGARIHGTEIRAELEQRLIAAGHDPKKLLLTKAAKKLAVKPGSKSYDRYLQDVTRELTSSSSAEFKRNLALAARAIVPEIYRRLAAQNFEQVQIALNGSRIDGTDAEKQEAINKLKSLAQRIWVEEVLSDLF